MTSIKPWVFFSVNEDTFWTPDSEMASPNKGVYKKTPYPTKPTNQNPVGIDITPRLRKIRGVDIPRMRRLNFNIPEEEEAEFKSTNERT